VSGAPCTRSELVEGLRRAGLCAGNRVVVHSSYRSIGPVEGGPAVVVDALLEAVGGEGLLVVPTFTYDSARFDPLHDPGRSGVVSETARTRPDAVRSLHPAYSVAAIGRGAEELCRGHEQRAGTDVGTPLDRLAAAGGHVLLVGVGETSNTTVHVGEFHAGVRYLEIPFSPDWPAVHEIAAPGGEAIRVEYTRFPGCSRAFGALEWRLRRRGAVRDGRLGAALVQLIDGAAIVEETVAELRHDPAALLCTDAACYRCSRARRLLG
jgi:aminoglycoside 3-N-acetyltransferase